MITEYGVPPGQVSLKHTPHTYELVTVQHEDVYKTLAREGFVLADATRSCYANLDEFGQAYEWVAETLQRTRVTHPTFNPTQRAMFWLWARVGRNALVHDTEYYGDGHVLLTCRIPRNRVLLSGFDSFHSVINGSVVYSEEEMEEFNVDTSYRSDIEKELDAVYGQGWNLSDLSEAHQRKVRNTWRHIVLEDPQPGDWTQACVSHLELADVTDVRGVRRS